MSYPQQGRGWQGYPPPRQQPGGGYPPFPGPPPPKRNTGLIVVLCLLGVLLAGGAITAIVLLTGDDNDPQAQPGPPRSSAPAAPPPPPPAPEQQVLDAARTAATAINQRDPALARTVSCSPDKERDKEYQELPSDARADLDGQPTITGQTATVPVKITGGGQTKDSTISLKFQGGRWCVGK